MVLAFGRTQVVRAADEAARDLVEIDDESESYDPVEFTLVEQAAFNSLMRIKDGECERFDFTSITHGIDLRVRSHCERIKSGDVVIEVTVSVIEDT